MKYVFRLSLAFVFICTSMSIKAQHREIGAMSNAAMGFMYGPMYDIRPVVKWGAKFESVHRLRVDRTYLNFANYQGVGYVNLSTGIYLGHEWRKSINDKLFFTHGPEIGFLLFRNKLPQHITKYALPFWRALSHQRAVCYFH